MIHVKNPTITEKLMYMGYFNILSVHLKIISTMRK